MAWYWGLILFLAGALGGYILKDQLTEEFRSQVTIHKPKVRRGGIMDLDQAVEVNLKKMSFRERIQARRAQRKKN